MDMTKIRPRQNGSGGISGWSDFENQRDYLRISGGVAWPYRGRTGFVVLMAEEARNLETGTPAFYALVESKHRTDEEMLTKCVELARIVDAWYSNTTPQACAFSLHQFNLGQHKRRSAEIDLLNIPMLTEAGDPEQLFRYAEAELDKGTLGGHKRVFLTACPQVRAALQMVPEAWDTPEKILELPEVTSLYYALGAMFADPYAPPSRKPAFCNFEYDPLAEIERDYR